MAVPSAKRLTDADRESAAARLREAYIHGLLTHEELNARVEAVLLASNVDDLAPCINDIPILGTAPAPLRLAVSNGHVDRIGAWRIPNQIELELNHSTSILDFRTSALPTDGISLTVQAIRSRVVILVRPGEQISYENLGRHKSKVLDRNRAPRRDLSKAAVTLFGDLRASSLRILPPKRNLFSR